MQPAAVSPVWDGHGQEIERPGYLEAVEGIHCPGFSKERSAGEGGWGLVESGRFM